METVAWTNVEYKQTALPRLRIGEEIARRDSITSAKTHDSGYTSDPDWDAIPPCEIPLPPQLAVDPQPGAVLLSKNILHLIRSTGSSHPSLVVNAPLPGDIHQVDCSRKAGLLSVAGGSGAFLKTKLGNKQKAITSPPVNVTSCPSTSRNDRSVRVDARTFGPFKDLIKANRTKTSESAIFDDEPEIFRNKDVREWIKESLRDPPPAKERVSSIASLASTGSGGDYSVTDDSEHEEQEETTCALPKPTRNAIDRIMRKIEVNLGYVAYIQSAGGQPTRGQSSSGPSSTPGSRRGSAQHGPSGKRKGKLDDGTPNEDPDDDGSNKRRRVSVAATEDSVENGPRFACPFYKHDPIRYRNRKTCIGPGWPTVHRMKEHLYRSHAQPVFCPRCYTPFDSDGEYAMHARMTTCELSPPQPIDGIDRETLKLIRRRSPPMRLEEDKWKDTYHILFPEVHDGDIPSPYYDHDSPTEESRRFRRELLSRIRSELFTIADRENAPNEQALLHRVAEIIQRCEGDLLRSFQTGLESFEPSPYDAPSSVQPPANLTPLHSPMTFTPAGRGQSAGRHPSETMSVEPSDQPVMSPMQFPTVPGDDSLTGVSSDWIDWNAIFPPAWNFPSEPTEPAPTLLAPVWT
ncbi:hypothetical protein BCR34DRAFT_591516 [Clohesyomyces aquaticus]|uniref:C2H2-type domain-containing protein n=1 Tax=Clohesyomyces aquaticus TaxID=1231657 RepID=A0A1Y1YZS1_9PLEO|nr:hypothetical protein BCR34DRAFT_591516 [Clohesyomyces aquaticus]